VYYGKTNRIDIGLKNEKSEPFSAGVYKMLEMGFGGGCKERIHFKNQGIPPAKYSRVKIKSSLLNFKKKHKYQ